MNETVRQVLLVLMLPVMGLLIVGGYGFFFMGIRNYAAMCVLAYLVLIFPFSWLLYKAQFDE